MKVSPELIATFRLRDAEPPPPACYPAYRVGFTKDGEMVEAATWNELADKLQAAQ